MLRLFFFFFLYFPLIFSKFEARVRSNILYYSKEGARISFKGKDSGNRRKKKFNLSKTEPSLYIVNLGGNANNIEVLFNPCSSYVEKRERIGLENNKEADNVYFLLRWYEFFSHKEKHGNVINFYRSSDENIPKNSHIVIFGREEKVDKDALFFWTYAKSSEIKKTKQKIEEKNNNNLVICKLKEELKKEYKAFYEILEEVYPKKILEEIRDGSFAIWAKMWGDSKSFFEKGIKLINECTNFSNVEVGYKLIVDEKDKFFNSKKIYENAIEYICSSYDFHNFRPLNQKKDLNAPILDLWKEKVSSSLFSYYDCREKGQKEDEQKENEQKENEQREEVRGYVNGIISSLIESGSKEQSTKIINDTIINNLKYFENLEALNNLSSMNFIDILNIKNDSVDNKCVETLKKKIILRIFSEEWKALYEKWGDNADIKEKEDELLKYSYRNQEKELPSLEEFSALFTEIGSKKEKLENEENIHKGYSSWKRFNSYFDPKLIGSILRGNTFYGRLSYFSTFYDLLNKEHDKKFKTYDLKIYKFLEDNFKRIQSCYFHHKEILQEGHGYKINDHIKEISKIYDAYRYILLKKRKENQDIETYRKYISFLLYPYRKRLEFIFNRNSIVEIERAYRYFFLSRCLHSEKNLFLPRYFHFGKQKKISLDLEDISKRASKKIIELNFKRDAQIIGKNLDSRINNLLKHAKDGKNRFLNFENKGSDNSKKISRLHEKINGFIVNIINNNNKEGGGTNNNVAKLDTAICDTISYISSQGFKNVEKLFVEYEKNIKGKYKNVANSIKINTIYDYNYKICQKKKNRKGRKPIFLKPGDDIIAKLFGEEYKSISLQMESTVRDNYKKSKRRDNNNTDVNSNSTEDWEESLSKILLSKEFLFVVVLFVLYIIVKRFFTTKSHRISLKTNKKLKTSSKKVAKKSKRRKYIKNRLSKIKLPKRKLSKKSLHKENKYRHNRKRNIRRKKKIRRRKVDL